MRAIRSAILGMIYFYYLGFHSLNFPCIYILPILGSSILHKTHGRIGAYGTVAVWHCGIRTYTYHLLVIISRSLHFP